MPAAPAKRRSKLWTQESVPPVTYREQRRMQTMGGSTNLIEATKSTNNRARITDNNYDSSRNIDKMGRQTLATLGRWVVANNGIPRGTLEEIAGNVTENIDPQFAGSDQEWGERAEELLRMTDEISDVRGHPGSVQETERQLVLSAFRTGDLYVQNCLSASGMPVFQTFPSHRIRSHNREEIIEEGPWRGYMVRDGIIVNRMLRPVAFRYQAHDRVTYSGAQNVFVIWNTLANGSRIPVRVEYRDGQNNLLYADVNSFIMHQSYFPEWEDQIRGYSLLGASVFNWQDVREARAFDLINRKLFASRAFVEYNDAGEAQGGSSVMDENEDLVDPSTNRQARLDSEVVDGVTISYLRAGSGSKVEAVQDNRPTQEVQAYENEVIRTELHAIGWSYDFSYNPQAVTGAMTRVLVDRINRRIQQLRNKLVIPWRRKFDTFRIARFIELGMLPYNPEWYMWDYSGFTRITPDAKHDAQVDTMLLKAGLTTRKRVAQKRNHDWKELDAQNEVEIDNLLDSATRLSKRWKISLSAAIKLLQDNGSQISEFEQKGGTDTEGGTNHDVLKADFDSYGIGVRSGGITPTVEDEEHFRKKAGLPPLSESARKAWSAENNVRRPITLTQPGGGSPMSAQPAGNDAEDDDDEDDDPQGA